MFSDAVSFNPTFMYLNPLNFHFNPLQEKIHVLPDLRILQKALRDDEGNISQMNIPEYLVYASKRYCNYKAIIAAIEQSCDDVDVKYFTVVVKHLV